MKYLIVLFLLVIIYVEGDRHLNANGPFGKRHDIGDEPSPHACSRRIDISSSSRESFNYYQYKYIRNGLF
jgi:hypothetical protein